MRRQPQIEVLAEDLRDHEVSEAIDALQARAGGAVHGSQARGANKPTGGVRSAPELHPTVVMARRLGPFKTTAEVAEELEVQPATIRKWARRRLCDAPSFAVSYGEQGRMMALYVQADIDRLRKWASKHRRRVIVPMRRGQRRVPLDRTFAQSLS